uniref:G-protein coupled receptors family 1 profile domain-containing protein n=1 Tax=Sus scrofa TaxID=9823 RepID=A0A287A8E2_PIG
MTPHANGTLSGKPLQEFVLEGFQGGLQTQALLFALFLALYLAAVLGNLTMIVVITLDARLHSPMYFFLKNLSFMDLCYSSVIYPKALANVLSLAKVISFGGCASQFFFFSMMGTTEAFLLAVMAYDRFLAICSPLTIPSPCAHQPVPLVLGCYGGGCLNAILQTSFTFSLPFCSSNHINHFFCDVPPSPARLCDTAIKAGPVWHLRALHRGHHTRGPHLLCLHHRDHPEDALGSRQTQALLHLWLPHDGRVPLLWNFLSCMPSRERWSPWSRARWSLSSTPWSSPCSTPSSTVCGTRR